MKAFILFGKHLLNKEGELDWVATARCDLAVKLIQDSPSAMLIVTGGFTTTSLISEAEGMLKYLEKKLPAKTLVVLEQCGLSTINQLCITKEQYLVPKNISKVGLISDELHVKRIELIASHLLGSSFQLVSYGAKIKLSGHYRKAIEKKAEELYLLTKQNPIFNHCSPGDHRSWARFDKFYRDAKLEIGEDRLEIIDLNDKFLELLFTKKD